MEWNIEIKLISLAMLLLKVFNICYIVYKLVGKEKN